MSDIAVVIPCYNRANVLRRTIEGILSQTKMPREIVVVDDGSTEDLRAVVNAFTDRLPLRYLRLEKNGGAPRARNEGARQTTAEQLLFLDADAVLIPTALEQMSRALEEHPEAAFVYGDFRWGWKIFRGRTFDPDALRERNYIHTISLLRREAFPGFDESLKKFQDWDLWLTISERGGQGVWIPEVLFDVSIEKHEKSISRWLPKFVHRIPWPIFGWMPAEIRKYREAEAIVRRKHGIS